MIDGAPARGAAAEIPHTAWVEAAIIALAAWLCFTAIGTKGFWFDETLSVERASRSWSGLWSDVTSTQANMGLYYVLLHGWLALGDSEATVRALSAVFAIAAVAATFGLTSRLFGTTVGLTASLLLALNSFFLRYAQEARGYSLALLLVIVSTWAFVSAVEGPNLRRWALYSVTAIASLYGHFFAALVIAAHAFSLVGLRRDSIPWRYLIGSATAIGVVASPLLWFIAFRDVGQIDWVPRPHAGDLPAWFAAFSGGGSMLAVICAVAIAIAAMSARRTSNGDVDDMSRWRVGLVVAWLVVPPAMAFAASFAKPIFQQRYLIVALPAVVMLVSLGLSRLRRRAVFASVLVVVVMLSVIQVRAWYDAPDRQWWRAAVQHTVSRAQPGDAVGFFVYSARVPFEYYATRLGLTAKAVTLIDFADGWIAGNLQPDPSRDRVRAAAEAHHRVWLVRLQDATPPGHPLRRYEQGHIIEEELMRAGLSRARSAAFPGGIRVEEWGRGLSEGDSLVALRRGKHVSD